MKLPSSVPGLGSITGTRSSLLIIILCAAGFVLFLPIRSNFTIRKDIKEARIQLADLKILYPLYAEMMSMEKPANWPDLMTSAREVLKETDVVDVPKRMLRLAARASVDLSLASPRVQIDEDGQRWLIVEIRVTGMYDNLRRFLVSLVQLPYLDRFERIELRQESLGEQLDVTVRLDLD